MICPYCGKETSESSSTCNQCGRWLVDVDKASTSVILPQAVNTSPDATHKEKDAKAAQPAGVTETSAAQPSVDVEKPTAQPEISSPGQIELPQKLSNGGLDKYIPWFIGCFVLLCLTVSCITLIWGFYSFSTVLDFVKLPTPIPTPSPTPSLLFSDDFSDPNSDWPISNESDYINDYYNGAYRMVENLDNMTSWAYPTMDSSDDMIIEVDATKNGGPDENNMGVMCRFQDNEKFYFGLITSDGYYGIVKRTSGEFIVIGHEYLEYSDLIDQGSTTNHIRLECIGDVLTLYANGHLLDQQADMDYAFGEAGLIIATYDTPGTDILFDNFFVYKP